MKRNLIGLGLAAMLLAGCGDAGQQQAAPGTPNGGTPAANGQAATSEPSPATAGTGNMPQPGTTTPAAPGNGTPSNTTSPQTAGTTGDSPAPPAGTPAAQAETGNRLLSQLGSDDADDRAAAAAELAEQQTPADVAVPALLPLLDDSDPQVAEAARRSIQTIAWEPGAVLVDFYADWCGPCRIMKPIVHQLQREGHPIIQIDTDVEKDLARQYGIFSIPTFAVIDGGKEITRAVGAVSREKLLELLKQIPEKSAGTPASAKWETIGVLAALAGESNWDKRQAGAHLARGGEEVALQLTGFAQDREQPQLLRRAAIQALDVIAASGPTPAPTETAMSDLLADTGESAGLRGYATLWLSRHGSIDRPELGTALIGILDGSHGPELRAAAAEELGHRGTAEALSSLMEAADDSDEPVVLASITALGQYGTRADSAVSFMLQAYEDTDSLALRKAIGESLREISLSSGKAPRKLAVALASDSEEVRSLAATLLKEANFIREAAAELAAALDSEHQDARRIAAILLTKIGGARQETADLRKIADVLTAALGDESLRWEAGSALGRLGIAGDRALATAVAAEGTSPVLRLRAVERLSNRGTPQGEEITSLLESVLKSDKRHTAVCAAIALSTEQSKRPELVPLLVEGLKLTPADQENADEEQGDKLPAACVQALIRLHEAGVDVAAPLLEALTHTSQQVGRSAAYGLQRAELSPEQNAGVLKLLELPESRAAAVVALSSRKQYSEQEIAAVARALRSADEEQAEHITRLLGQAGEAALPALRQLAAESKLETHQRAAAIKAAGTLAQTVPAALPVLRQALQDSDSTVKLTAAAGLAATDAEVQELLPILLEALSSEDWSAKYPARQGLQAIASRAGAFDPALFEQLGELDDEHQAEILQAHVSSHGAPSRVVLEALLELARDSGNDDARQTAVRALAEAGEPALADLVQLLGEPNTDLQTAVLQSLTSLEEPAPELSDVVRDHLASEDENMAVLAALFLLRAGDHSDRVVETVVRGMQSSENSTRYRVFNAFYRVKELPEAMAPALLAMLPERDFRDRAVIGLGKLASGGAAAVEPLTELLDSVHAEDYVLTALGQLGPAAAAARPILLDRLRHGSDLRRTAFALKQISRDSPNEREDAGEVLAILIQQGKDRAMDLETCVAIGHFAEAAPGLVEPVLVESAGSTDPTVRRSAVRMLGAIRSETAIRQLQQSLEEDDTITQAAALGSLGRIGLQAETIVPLLQARVESTEDAVRRAAIDALGDFGPDAAPAVPQLLALLNDRQGQFRYAAATALGQIGEPARETLPVLIELLQDRKTLYVGLAGLEEFGPLAKEAIPALKEARKTADRHGRQRIERVLKKISSEKPEGESQPDE